MSSPWNVSTEVQILAPTPAVPAKIEMPTTNEEDETPLAPTNEAPTTPEANTQPEPTEVNTPTGEEAPAPGEEPMKVRTPPIKPPAEVEVPTTSKEGDYQGSHDTGGRPFRPNQLALRMLRTPRTRHQLLLLLQYPPKSKRRHGTGRWFL